MPSGSLWAVTGGVTPVPNALFDALLPSLKDTELRVLLVVLRATSGWMDTAGNGHKRRDWISSAQMRKRTGRGSEAVSAAIAALTKRGLLVVEDEEGQPLVTAKQRRRHLGQLYYRKGNIHKPHRDVGEVQSRPHAATVETAT